jgi:hypothetical protein
MKIMKRFRSEGEPSSCHLCPTPSFSNCVYCGTNFCRDHSLNNATCGIKHFLSTEFTICKSCLLNFREAIDRSLKFLDNLELENLTEKFESNKINKIEK